MNKARRKEPKGGNMEELQAPGLSHFKGGKSEISPSQDNKYPKTWCFSPCPYESNKPKNTSIGVRMRKQCLKYERSPRTLTTTGTVIHDRTTLYRDRFVKLNNICEGPEAISGAGVSQDAKPTSGRLYKERKTLAAINNSSHSQRRSPAVVPPP